MSRRRWEKLLCRARVILDLLEQRKHKILFRFLHAEAERLDGCERSFVNALSDPDTTGTSIREWRLAACAAAVQLQFQLARAERDRSEHNQKDNDALGGATLNAVQQSQTAASTSEAIASQKRQLVESRLSAYKRKAMRLGFMNGCFPTLVQPSSLTFAATPATFNSDTAAEVDVLKILRVHPRDFNIGFQAADHTYYIDGQKTKGSVTRMIHAFSNPFQADQVITKMIRGWNWPRAGYLRHEVSFTSMSRLRVLCPELLDLYACNPRDDARICHLLRDVTKYHDIADEVAQLSLSPREIKEMWRTEWTIYGEAENITGSIDFCVQLPDGSVILIDWKRTSGLRDKYKSFQPMRPPMDHIADRAGMHYRLQLNVYRHLLEKYYSLRVSGMLVVCCHPEHYPTPFVDCVPRLEEETNLMLKTWCDARGGSGLISASHERFAATGNIPRDAAGGASQASAVSDVLPPVGGLAGDATQHEQLVARDDTFLAEEIEADNGLSQELERNLDEVMELEAGEQNIRLAQARKRRLLPGADATMDNFHTFFRNLFDSAERSLADVPPLAHEDEPSVPVKINRIRAWIDGKFVPKLDDALLRLFTGAVTVYRLRLTDLHLRKLVVLLWIVEGGRHMRCHDGNLCFFNLGAFALHKGVPPQATLARCKRFSMQLEGLFRLMGDARLSNDEDVLESVRGLLEIHNHSARLQRPGRRTDQGWLHCCAERPEQVLLGNILAEQ